MWGNKDQSKMALRMLRQASQEFTHVDKEATWSHWLGKGSKLTSLFQSVLREQDM